MGLRFQPRRLFSRLLIALLATPFVLIAYLQYFGFPAAARDRLLRPLERRGFCLELQQMRLSLPDGIVLREVKLFQKGVVGPPLFQAEDVRLSFDILKGSKAAYRLSGISVANGALRQDAALGKLAPGGGGMDAINLKVNLDRFDLLKLRLDSFQCALGIRGPDIKLDGIEAVVGDERVGGPLSGWIAYSGYGDKYRGYLAADFDPREALPMVQSLDLRGLASVISSFVFDAAAPRIEMNFYGVAAGSWTLILDGTFRGRHFMYETVDIQTGEFPFFVEWTPDRKSVRLEPLLVRREEGNVNVDLAVDLSNDVVRFNGVSTADPEAVARMISSSGPAYIADYRLTQPLRVEARGSVNYTNTDICEFEADIEAGSAAVSDFVAGRTSFTLRRSGRTTSLSDVDASIYGGTLSGSATFYPDTDSTNMRYSVSAGLDKIDFHQLCRVLVGTNNNIDSQYEGKLSGNVEMEGIAARGKGGELKGHGKLRIRDGQLFRFPLFGGLSDLLIENIPGLGYVLRQTQADAEFTISGGKATTSEMRVEGDILSLRSEGDYDFMDDRLNFWVEMRFLKRKLFVAPIIQTVFLPVSKMFKAHLSGSIENPKWAAVNF